MLLQRRLSSKADNFIVKGRKQKKTLAEMLELATIICQCPMKGSNKWGFQPDAMCEHEEILLKHEIFKRKFCRNTFSFNASEVDRAALILLA